jgi:hypothetical protein
MLLADELEGPTEVAGPSRVNTSELVLAPGGRHATRVATHEPTGGDAAYCCTPRAASGIDAVAGSHTALTPCWGTPGMALRGRHGWDPQRKRYGRKHDDKALPHPLTSL